jgi:hypothetical protein
MVGDAVMLAVTLLLDRDLGLGAPDVPARGRRFVTDRHGPTATNGAISADLHEVQADALWRGGRPDLDDLSAAMVRSDEILRADPPSLICARQMRVAAQPIGERVSHTPREPVRSFRDVAY